MDEQSEGICKSGRRSSDAESEEDYPAKRYRFWDSSSSSSCYWSDDDMDDRGQKNTEARSVLTTAQKIQMDADLHEAVSKQELELIGSLIQRGASVNSIVPKLGETPLTMICKQRRPTSLRRKSTYMEIIHILLDNGASVNRKNSTGLTPLHLANSADVVKALVEKGASIDELGGSETPLYAACRRYFRSVDVISALLEAGASVNGANAGDTPPLYAASYTATTLLLQKGANVDQVARNGRSSLFVHCEKPNGTAAISALLEHGASINLKDTHGLTPLHVSCQHGLINTVQLLLQKGASVNEADNDGETPLFFAAKKPAPVDDIITLLVEHGASINLKDTHGLTPLHVSCQRGLINTVQLLLQKGASVNEADNNGETPLFFAAKKPAPVDDIITLLVEHGASVNVPNSCGKTPLHVCRFSATILIQNGASVDALDNKHETPLFTACRRKSRDGLLAALLQHGASVNAKNNEGDTPLHFACRYLLVFTSSLLLRHGADVNGLNNKHESPLLSAMKPSCPKELVELLLDSGADINLKNGEGQTPLHVACSKGIMHLVKLLVQKGASVNELDNEQASPLMAAIVKSTRADDIIITLLERGASVNVQTTKGVTLLHILCARSRDKSQREQILSLVDRLLQQGAIVNGVDSKDETPLEVACSVKPSDATLITRLLENGATVNRKNSHGQTPLHLACRIRQPQCDTAATLALLQHGASVNATDEQGRTPFDVSTNESARLLLQYGSPRCPIHSCADRSPCSSKHSVIADFIQSSLRASSLALDDLETYIGQTNVTYHDLFHLQVPRPDFEDVLSTVTPQLLETAYPNNECYRNMVYCSYLKIKRLQRMEGCCCLFNFISPFLPPEIAFKIFSYLDLGDLTALHQILYPVQKR